MSTKVKTCYTLSQFKDSGAENIFMSFIHLAKDVDEWIGKNKIEATFFDGQKIEKRYTYSLLQYSIFEYTSKYDMHQLRYFCHGYKTYSFEFASSWMDIKKIDFLSKSTLNKIAKIVWIMNKRGINIKSVKYLVKFLYLTFKIHKVKYISNVGKDGKLIDKMLPKRLFKKEYILDIDYQNNAMKRFNKLNLLENKVISKWWNKMKTVCF